MGDYAITQTDLKRSLSQKVVYQIMFKTFTVEGTIRAATQRLGHVASLGVDILYLSPFCEMDDDEDRSAWSERQIRSGMNNPKNPYRIGDYFRIDGEYGTEEDLREFMTEAHRLGLEVWFDLVYMHCGPGKFGKAHPNFLKRDGEGNILCSKYHFPYLDFANPALCEYLWGNMLYWVEQFDVDGYRCDVGDKVPLDFWREGKRRIEAIKPGFCMVNEGQDPTYLYEVFDAAYYNHDLSWNEVIQKTFKKGRRGVHHHLRGIDGALRAYYPEGALLLRGYENHDFVIDSMDARLDRTHPCVTDALLVLDFVLDGVPLLYSGNEFADCRRHTMWRWSGDEFCVDWGVLGTSRGQERMNLTRALCDLRHREPTLCHGKTCMEKAEELLIFTRTYGEESIRAIFRFEGPTVAFAEVTGEILLCGNVRKEGDVIHFDEGGYLIERIKKSVG